VIIKQTIRKLPPKKFLMWLIAALSVGLFYLAVSAWGFGFTGFPLDDAWIHQTYARNLARSGQFAVVPGVPSAGSTAPLWSFLLSLGYLLRIPFLIWTYGLGLILLALTGWTVARLGDRLFPQHHWVGRLAGLFCIFEWHLVWAAVSGMETILFIWLSTFLVERYLALSSSIRNLQPTTPNRQHLHFAQAQVSATRNLQSPIPNLQSPISYFGLGLLGGLLILTRPEGVGLVGLIGLDIAFRGWLQKSERISFVKQVLRCWLLIMAGVGLLLIPYIGLHLWATGLPFPNTFYAKQTEYRIILERFPLWWRLFGNFGPSLETVQGVFRVIFIGPQILLLPGLFFGAWLTAKERRTALIPIWLWWISFLLLYGLRLPVTYQHGRYQIPAIAWVVLLGVWGTTRLVAGISKRNFVTRALGRALVGSLPILVLAFIGLGAQAYGRDVRFIESEMVTTARWLNDHTAPDALIAAHDIGAIGYFTERPLIDLAGLVTPEVIPIIRDEARLFDFMVDHQAVHLVTFPSWYPELTHNPNLTLIYQTNAPWAPQAGGDNMAVYQLDAVAKP
jgi:hypothetical protein